MVYSVTTNRMNSRATPDISLYESNEEGGHYFMSLNSGKRIHSRKWAELPISEHAEARVYEIGANDKQPILLKKMPLFEWIPGMVVEPHDDGDESSMNEVMLGGVKKMNDH